MKACQAAEERAEGSMSLGVSPKGTPVSLWHMASQEAFQSEAETPLYTVGRKLTAFGSLRDSGGGTYPLLPRSVDSPAARFLAHC